MNYETLALSTHADERMVRQLFSVVTESVSVFEPLLIHLQLYSEISGVNRITLADTYLEVKRRFTQILSSDSALWEEDKRFPSSLLAAPHHPPFLYMRGDLALLNTERVIITGTRNPSDRGKKLTEQLVQVLYSKGITPVSGLEKGIEGMVHLFSLSHDIPSVAFIDTSLHHDKDPNRSKLREFIGEKGLLLTSVPPSRENGTADLASYKSYINSYGTAVIIVEEKDGGHAVKRLEDALEQHIPVFLFGTSVEDRSILWPRRYANHPLVSIVRTPEEIPPLLKKGEKEPPPPDIQLPLF